MPVIVRLLAASVATAVSTNLYEVPTTVAGAIVSNVRLVNTGGQVNVNIYFRASGGVNPIRIFDRDASLGTALTILKPELTMGPGDRIEMSTTSSPQVEYVVCGIEKV